MSPQAVGECTLGGDHSDKHSATLAGPILTSLLIFDNKRKTNKLLVIVGGSSRTGRPM